MKSTLARWLHSTLNRLAIPALFARLWWRGRKERSYRRNWLERLGWGGPVVRPGAVWVHADSLGEARLAGVLVDALRRLDPKWHYLITHDTAIGRAAGRELLEPGDVQVWVPVDTPGATRRFLRRHRPMVGVVMERVNWPNLLFAARDQGVPVMLANARLSDEEFRRAQSRRALMTPALESLTLVLAQSDPDARRLASVGARQVRMVGNLKFDVMPPVKLIARGLQWRQVIQRPVVFAASTREGEEVPLLRAWAARPAPRPLLLIVPRRASRFNEVARAVRRQGLTLQRRSRWRGGMPPPEAQQADVWLGDSVGEMALYYGMSDAALLGGSFGPHGGQNLIEAAVSGCPVVLGPNTSNYAQVAELSVAAGAATRVYSIEDGVTRAIAMARDPARNHWVKNAFEFTTQHRGADKRVVGALLAMMAGASREPRKPRE